MGKVDSSFVDIFLDRSMGGDSSRRRKTATTRRAGKRRPFPMAKNNNYYQFCCHKYIVVVLVTTIALISVVSTIYTTRVGSRNKKNNARESLLQKFQQMLTRDNISDEQQLQDPKAPQYLSIQWLKHLDDDDLDHILKMDSNNEDATMPDDDTLQSPLLRAAYALGVLYYSTNDGNNSQWNTDDHWISPTPVCQWYGIDCEDQRRIVHLNLTNNNLRGSLPTEVQLLSDLRVFDVSQNSLQGTVPESIGNAMTVLEYLVWNENAFSGTLPTTWRNMSNLVNAQLYQNQLHGSLPTELNQWTRLQTLAIQNNSFSGSVPYLQGLQDLQYLTLQNNNFEDEIPYGIFRLNKLGKQGRKL